MSQPAETDAGEQKRGTCVRSGEAEIRGHRHDGARSRAGSLHGGQHGLRTLPHRHDEVAGHAREAEQPRRIHAGQGTDDVVHIAA